MTPNDALSQTRRSHRQSPASSTPSLRRRLTRSPSPSISIISADSKSLPIRRLSFSSDSDSPMSSARRRKPSFSSVNTNGHSYTNGISHVPEETGEDILDDMQKVSRPEKIDWEIPRKTLHASIGFLTIGLYTLSFEVKPVVNALAASLLVVTSAEILRFRSRRFELTYERYLGFLMRESEKHKTNGVVWYLCGVLCVLLVFPLDVAVVSILILSWADTAASTIGRLCGARTPKLPSQSLPIPVPFLARQKWPRLGFASRKSMAGFMASTTTGFLIATTFWGYFASLRDTPPTPDLRHGYSSVIGLGVVSGLLSGVTEALDLGSLDDNLTLPTISGGLIWGFIRLIW